MAKILGITFGGHDTAASLVIDGKIIAAGAQERYSLDKHSRLFPIDAINDCLKIAGLKINDLDEIAFANDSKYHIREFYLKSAIEDEKRIDFLIQDIERLTRINNIEEIIRKETSFQGPINFYKHHLCHIASAYYPSGFNDALLVSIDGMGEIETGIFALGKSGDIEIIHQNNRYPNSFGLLYSAITFYLGWKHHCDEGIIMGLAPYGNAHATIPGENITYYEVFCDILIQTSALDYEINPDWMVYHTVRDKWVSDKFYQLFGPKRNYEDPITDHHKNIAAALQLRLETVFLSQLLYLKEKYNVDKLCLSGGVALNCSMNGKIMESGIFKEIFVQPASGDDGTTLGACFLATKKLDKSLKPNKQHNFYLGSGCDELEIIEAARKTGLEVFKPENIFELTAKKIFEGKIIGWFQGRSEFGPRALGNRSILARPFPAEMKDYVNDQVKFREYFRPFAPVILAENTREYFQITQESPHMLIACQVQPEKKNEIPAVVHVDGSSRVQTVTNENNKELRSLLQEFYKVSGTPVLMNTSFNVKGQPIVNTPEQALNTFKNTKIDCLVIGDYFFEK